MTASTRTLLESEPNWLSQTIPHREYSIEEVRSLSDLRQAVVTRTTRNLHGSPAVYCVLHDEETVLHHGQWNTKLARICSRYAILRGATRAKCAGGHTVEENYEQPSRR